MNFYMVRLGVDSVPTITALDQAGAPTPLNFDVVCKQVPTALANGDFVFVWLGTDNSKGSPTTWKQGLRALGKVTNIAGPPDYNAAKTVSLSVGYVLPASINKWDSAQAQSVHYRELFNMPVLGSNNYSSQVIQHIDPTKPAQNLSALFSVIEEYQPNFRTAVEAIYPELIALFAELLPSLSGVVALPSTVSAPELAHASAIAGSWDIPKSELDNLDGLVGMEEAALRAVAALNAGMHVILTGAPGTGKTQLAETLCRKAGFPSWTVPATDQWTTFETIGGYFPVPEAGAGNAADRLDFLPGAILDSISRGNCLIIDEINRADIDKAFGEMFTLLAGSSVTLPYKRRGPDGFLRIRIQLDDSPVDADMDVIPVPRGWRMIGAMNDADKASLKRLSLAFVRRFAFVPVGLPDEGSYAALLNSRLASFEGTMAGEPRVAEVLASVKRLFCSRDSGFAKIGMPFGPAIPLALLRQVVREAAMDVARTSEELLAAGLDLYVAPQFQGRADCHEACAELIAAEVSIKPVADASIRTLGVWTGYDA
ncbi:AAA family ATPase [Acidovorax sp. K2F]|uniref:AAA family ATPase n=1 Tax=Acidovorax sp. K2F TaxID=2978125 RepID=UPI0021B0EC42|nr:AAA family ATPase [Acidovorax sp. K2F]MCT6721626.1 AAA family ATPase [Acidovorax sp. K2F]